MEVFTDFSQTVVMFGNINCTAEVITEQHIANGKTTDKDGWNGQQNQWTLDHPAGFMQMFFGVFIHTLFTMKYQEEHTERIKRGNKHTGQHRIISKLSTGNT